MLASLEPVSNVIDVNPEAFSNALKPMLVTFAGIVTCVKRIALKNAFAPILFKLEV